MRFKRESLFAPVSVPCFDYKGEDGEPVRKTVIIAPIRIVDDGNGTVQISWACNRGAFCKNIKEGFQAWQKPSPDGFKQHYYTCSNMGWQLTLTDHGFKQHGNSSHNVELEFPFSFVTTLSQNNLTLRKQKS